MSKRQKMPRGKAKKKRERNGLPPEPVSPDEDSESVCSSLDGGSIYSEDGGPLVGGGEDVGESEEDVQFQLLEHIDQLGDKSSRTRLSALDYINKVFGQKIVTQHLLGSKETVIDVLIKGLKKVRGGERCGLLQLAMLLGVQLGGGHSELLVAVKPVVSQLMLDPSVSAQERAASVHVLGICTFIQAPDTLEVESVMRDCEQLFKCKLEPVVAAAVRSWSLLLSIAPNSTISPLILSLLPVLNGLLENTEMNIRIAVGQAIALLFELARELGSNEEPLDTTDGSASYDLITQLATESSRYTARKDRNQQRSSFRDVLQTLEDGSVPERDVKFSVEVLSLDSWAKLIQYDAFRDLLGPGMNTHLQGNELLREIFQLGPPPLVTVESKASRLERKYYNAALAKHRTQSRSKQRDKRAVL